MNSIIIIRIIFDEECEFMILFMNEYELQIGNMNVTNAYASSANCRVPPNLSFNKYIKNMNEITY